MNHPGYCLINNLISYQVIQNILRHVNFDVVKAVIIASPGFVRQQFFDYMYQQVTTWNAGWSLLIIVGFQAVKTDNKLLFENKSKFMLVHSSSGFKHSLKEVSSEVMTLSLSDSLVQVLQDPAVQARLSDTKATEEVKVLETFYKMLKNEPDRAFYGPKHVRLAVEAEAVETLLVSDNLFRANDVAERRKYVDMVDKVKETGGNVKIFSSLHISGEQLDQLSGICALLRFPMAEIEDTDDSDSD